MPELKLWLIEQNERTGYDVYDSAVVVAADEASARLIHPSQYAKNYDPTMSPKSYHSWTRPYGSWATHPDKVMTTFLGVADPALEDGAIVCASFNAG